MIAVSPGPMHGFLNIVFGCLWVAFGGFFLVAGIAGLFASLWQKKLTQVFIYMMVVIWAASFIAFGITDFAEAWYGVTWYELPWLLRAKGLCFSATLLSGLVIWVWPKDKIEESANAKPGPEK